MPEEEKKKRSIKFRAWDKQEKKMYACAGFLSGQVILSLEDGKVLGKKDDDFELMQFTGLLDKNGKEVYEGDIVRGYHAITSMAPIYQVVWNDGKGANLGDQVGWWLDDGYYKIEVTTYLGISEMDREEYMDMTVIGNIYENPEMVEEEKK